jgi:hypothetical protein
VNLPSETGLRAGEWVEVRSKEAILATLDANGRLDELPFMPEMLAYCGKRFRVWKRAHKTCDTVNKTGGRRMTAAVHLEDVRCNGEGHGGCQAACLIFWKEAWLRRVKSPDSPSHQDSAPRHSDVESHLRDRDATEEIVWAAVCASGSAGDTDATYVCQATALPQATTFLPWWDFRQYLEDYTSRNASLWRLLSGGVYVSYDLLIKRVARSSWRAAVRLIRLYDLAQALVGGVPYPRKGGTVPLGDKTPSRPLNLKAGDLVKVRTYPEILSTLDRNNKNKGLYFDAEEVPYCGKTYRVRSTVTKIIDEKTGKMLTFKDPSVILDGVFCQARYSDRRMICPRAIYSLWRETWLERVEEHTNARR